MSRWRTSWSKELREKARKEGKELFLLGITESHNRRFSGRWECFGMIDTRRAGFLFEFARALYKGLEPKEAFEEVDNTFSAKKSKKGPEEGQDDRD